MNAQYQRHIERTINLSQLRAKHHEDANLTQKMSLAREFGRKGGPGWSTSGSVFTHIEHEARAKAYNDLIRLFTTIQSGSLSHESAVADLENAIILATSRLEAAQEEIVKALNVNKIPADQIGWVEHRARIEVLEEHLQVLKANPPSEFEKE
jgi:hypothetical protein